MNMIRPSLDVVYGICVWLTVMAEGHIIVDIRRLCLVYGDGSRTLIIVDIRRLCLVYGEGSRTLIQ